MQTADDQNIDEQLKKTIKAVPLDQPHPGFTDRFMDRLGQEAGRSLAYAYAPLISFRTGVIIITFCAALVVALMTSDLPQSFLSLRLLDVISIEWEGWNALTAKIGTTVVVYAMVILIIGMGIQFYYLKRWHARQLYM